MINKIRDDVQIIFERLKQNYTWIVLIIIDLCIVLFGAKVVEKYLPVFNNNTINDGIQIMYNLLVLIVFLLGTIMIVLNANYSGEIREKEEALKIAGFINSYGNAPSIIKIERKGYGVLYYFYSAMLPLDKYEKNKDTIQNALNINIKNMKYVKDQKHIVVSGIDKNSKQYPDKILWKDEYLSDEDFVLKLGRGEFEEIKIDIGHLPHILLASSTGGGKSSLLNLLLHQCYIKKAQIAIVDLKGGMDYLNWYEKCSVITKAETCLEYLEEMKHILDERTNLFLNAKVNNIHNYNLKASEKLPRIIIVFDEIGDILGVKKKDKETRETYMAVEEHINLLARKGRAFGLHIILCFQRPSADVLNGDIKINLGIKICGIADKIMSNMVLDNDDAAELIPIDSKGFFVTNMGGFFKAYYYEPDSDVRNDINI